MADPTACDECPAVLRDAFDTGVRSWCALCHSWWLPEAAAPFVYDVRLMACSLVELRQFLDRRERRETMVDGGMGYGTSASARALACAELGIVGTGARGTRGVGSSHGPTDAADAVYDAQRLLDGEAPPYAAQRLAEVVGTEAGPTLIFVRDYTRGETLYDLEVGSHKLTGVTLAQWCGLHLAADDLRAKWQAKIIVGDASPALSGADQLGNRLLVHAARTWFGA